MGKDVDLHEEPYRPVTFLAQPDQLREDRTPARIAREVVVGEEEVVGAQLGAAGLDGGREGDRVAGAHRPPLHVDDGTERASERTPAAGVQRGEMSIDELPGHAPVEARHRRVRQGGLSVDEIVDGRERAGGSIGKYLAPGLLHLPGDQGDPVVEKAPQLAGNVASRHQHSRDMKPADEHIQAQRTEPSGQVRGARKLVGLHADQTDQDLAAGPAGEAANAPLRHGVDRFIAQVGSQLDRTEQRVGARPLGERGQATQGRARQNTAQVAKQVALGVVLCRPDEKDLEAP